MKKLLSVFTFTLLTLIARGYDFKVDGLCYNHWSNSNEVYVTYEQEPWFNDGGAYPSLSGDITIPNTVVYDGITYSVTRISCNAFSCCSSLTSVIIPNSVTAIDTGAFTNSSLYNDPSNWIDNVLYIDSCLIKAKENITETCEILSGTRLVASDAFYNCSSLFSVTIPNSVTNIGYSAFTDCSSLTSVYYTGSIADWCNIDFASNPVKYARNLYINGNLLTDIIIPDEIKEIKAYTFSGCSSLTSVIIPNSVTSIGFGAFSGCSSLSTITIPSNVTNIEGNAFSGCSALTSLHIESHTPPTLSYDCFSKTPLSVIFVPSNTSTIYESLWGSDYLYIESGNEVELTIHVETPGSLAASIVEKGYMPIAINKLTVTGSLNDTDFSFIKNNMLSLYDLDMKGIDNTTLPDEVFKNNQNRLLYVVLPDNVNAISTSAFSGCTSLTSVVIPSVLTNIGDYAFEGCSALTSIIIPFNVKSIGNHVFSNCTSLIKVSLPTTLRNIGSSAFETCSSLSSVTIPSSVIRIGGRAFANCTSLSSVIIPSSVASIGGGAFSGCSSLASLSISNSVTSIEEGVFDGCISLSSVTIPSSVTSIKELAFSKCKSLTTITIGSGVENISSYAFSECSSLDTITCLGGNPPVVKEQFATINPSVCKLYVPQYALVDYIMAPVWGTFVNMEGIEVNYKLSLTISEGCKIIFQNKEYTDTTEISIAGGSEMAIQLLQHESYNGLSIRYNGIEYVSEMDAEGNLTLPAIKGDSKLEITNSLTGINSATTNRLRAWQAEGTIFAEVDASVSAVMVYDVAGRLMNEYHHNGNYQVITLPALNEVNILKMIGKDGNVTAYKLM